MAPSLAGPREGKIVIVVATIAAAAASFTVIVIIRGLTTCSFGTALELGQSGGKVHLAVVCGYSCSFVASNRRCVSIGPALETK
jgi:hypothetical protein